MNILLNMASYFIVYRYFRCFFTEKKKWYNTHIGVMIGIVFVAGMVLSARYPRMQFLLGNGIVLFLGIFYKEVIVTKLLIIFIFFVTRLLSHFTALCLMQQIGRILVHSGRAVFFHVNAQKTIVLVLEYLLVCILCRAKKEENIHLPKEANIWLFITLITELGGGYVMYHLLLCGMVDNHYRIFTCVVLMLLLIHYLTFLWVESANHYVAKNYQYQIALQERQYETTYYKELEHSIEELRRIRHDYRNQLLAVLALGKEQSRMQNEIMQLLEMLEQENATLYSKNKVLNGICKVKFAEAKSRDIEVQHSICVPDNLNIRCNELGVLYGNLLDNAIEASEQVAVGKRKIIFKTAVREEKLLLYIWNTCTGEQLSLPRARTSKKDEANHGFGIQNVRKIVDSYEGSIITEKEETQFVVKVMLYGIHGNA